MASEHFENSAKAMFGVEDFSVFLTDYKKSELELVLEKYDKEICSFPGVGGCYLRDDKIVVTVLPGEEQPALPEAIRDVVEFQVHNSQAF